MDFIIIILLFIKSTASENGGHNELKYIISMYLVAVQNLM